MSPAEFNTTLITHRPYLLRFANTLTFDKELAQDLVQETFYKALKNQHTYSAFKEATLKTWLATILKNEFINGTRRQKIKDIFISETKYLSSNHYETAYAKINAKVIIDQIDKLKSNLKTVFVLNYNGYSYQDIADKLNIPIGTVKARIHKARSILQPQLQFLVS